MNTFNATDNESVLRFPENCLALEKSLFKVSNNYLPRDVILTSFQMSSHCYKIWRQLL